MTSRVLAIAIAAGVGAAFVVMAWSDLRTSRVVVRQAKQATALAVVGLGGIAVSGRDWFVIIQAAAGAVLVTGIQMIPYWYQQRYGEERIGRADIRLAVPFGWTLGWFGIGFALVGYAIALVTGLAYGILSGRRRIPFVPFMTVGLWLGLAWAAAVALTGSR